MVTKDLNVFRRGEAEPESLSPSRRISSLRRWSSAVAIVASLGVSQASVAQAVVRPVGLASATAAPLFEVVGLAGSQPGGVVVAISAEGARVIRDGALRQRWTVPIGLTESLEIELEPFSVTGYQTRWLVGTPAGNIEVFPPEVALLRGRIVGEPDSRAFFALDSEGGGRGYVIGAAGRRYGLSQAIAADGSASFVMAPQPVGDDMPEVDELCRIVGAPVGSQPFSTRGSASDVTGLRVGFVNVEGDQSYVQSLFGGNVGAAQSYVLQVIAAVSDIYVRDLNLRLVINQVRLWPAGGEPFGADDIFGFSDWYLNNEDMTGIDLVHLFSGRRDLGYGGIAFFPGICQQSAFGISGFLLGSFPASPGQPHLGNWDLIVVAHEMGHNLGTGHTHDSYVPTIDDCGNGVPMRGTIMGYCHTHPGGTTNTSLFMHRLVEDAIEAELSFWDCLGHDCNTNGVRDADDLIGGALDSNSNSVPDVCEDCNTNGVLDPVDVLGGGDANANGVPDVCELDCNTNGMPDAFELDGVGGVNDLDGNNVPDVCDPDCNSNSVADFRDISSNGVDDFDRDNIPDICQDCNGNGTTDHVDLGRPGNLFVAERADYIREYHSFSGYPIRNLGSGAVIDPFDAVFGPDRQLYVASFANDRIVRIDIETGASSTFVAAGSGGLDGPHNLVFGPNGNLFVSSNVNHRVYEFNGATGAFVRIMVPTGSGGLSGPRGLAFTPGGNLLVASAVNSVLEFDGTSGAFVRVLVGVGSGGLSGPRGLLWMPDGRLLVCSQSNNRVLAYNGLTGASLGQFNQVIEATGAWGIRRGPNGNVYVVRSSGTIRVLEFTPGGLFVRSYVRGDTALPTPTGLDFRPAAPGVDCDGSGVLDACKPDFDSDLIPDPCDSCPLRKTGDCSGDGLVNTGDVSAFVAVLLDPAGASPPDYCAADVNLSGAPDGDDVAAFVALVLP